MSIEVIRIWRDMLAEQAGARGEPMFMGKPEAWYDDPHWFCATGHVSGLIIKSHDGDLCMACLEPVIMGPHVGEAEFAKILRAL